MSGYTFPRDTMDSLLTDHERRLRLLERRGHKPSTELAPMISVPTFSAIGDTTTPVYAEDTGLVHYGGATYSLDTWNTDHSGWAVCQVAMSNPATSPDAVSQDVSFDTEVLDPLGWHSNVTNPPRVTPNRKGWVRATLNCDFQSAADYGRRLIRVKRNGSNFTPIYGVDLGSGAAGLPVEGVLTVTAQTPLILVNGTTDYLTVEVHQDNTAGAARTHRVVFTVELAYAL